ncbi:MAG: hypothetical protein EBX35_04150, partial [Planctomycetia bacterium]|nr:hypothetical protein [Planctomycetia bacterium]
MSGESQIWRSSCSWSTAGFLTACLKDHHDTFNPLHCPDRTVGNFDGVHLGHAAIVRRLAAAAGTLGVPAVALTFDPHPASLVRPDRAPAPLTTPARRAELL